MNLSSWNNYISPNAPKPNGPNSPVFMVSRDAPSPSIVRANLLQNAARVEIENVLNNAVFTIKKVNFSVQPFANVVM